MIFSQSTQNKPVFPPQYFNSTSPSDSQAPLWAHLVSELQPNLSLSLQPSSSHKTWPLLDTSTKRIILSAQHSLQPVLASRKTLHFKEALSTLTLPQSTQHSLTYARTHARTHSHRWVPPPHPPSLVNPQQLQSLFQIKQITIQCPLGSSLA